jgi:hypothetical protein
MNVIIVYLSRYLLYPNEYKKWFTNSCTQIGLNPNYLFIPLWVQKMVYILLYPNWSDRKMFSEKCIVMIMRHKGGSGILPTALEHSDRHNLCRISRISTGRLICKTKPISTDSLNFCEAIGIITTNNQ